MIAALISAAEGGGEEAPNFLVPNATFLVELAVFGLLVFIRRPDDRRATLLFAMSVFGALSLIGAISTSLDGSNARVVLRHDDGPAPDGDEDEA